MKTRIVVIAILLCGLAACGDDSAPTGEPAGPIAMTARTGGVPTIEVLEPMNGAVVSSPFTVRVTTENVALAPAGRTMEGEAHWHVMVDVGCAAPGTVIQKDDTHRHVGTGDDTAEFDLSPGVHDLCVQLGDGFHVAVAVTDSIRVTVVE